MERHEDGGVGGRRRKLDLDLGTRIGRGEKNGGGRGRRRVSGAAEEDTVANNPPRDAIWNP